MFMSMHWHGREKLCIRDGVLTQFKTLADKFSLDDNVLRIFRTVLSGTGTCSVAEAYAMAGPT
jgi:hypothetical protein